MYELVFSNGLMINDTNDDIFNIEIISKLDSSVLTFGTVSSVSLNLKLNNSDKRFDTYIYKNKYVNIYINGVKKYKIYISVVRKKNGFITLQGNDKIADLDIKFKGCTFPCSIYTLITSCLKQCKLELGTIFFPNQGLVLHNVDLSGMTCREVLSYCMEVCGGIGLLDRNEKFVIKWFDTNKTQEIDTNRFISYQTDEEDIIFNNIRYMRNGVVYNSNFEPDTITNSLYLTSDNPLLKGCSAEKLQSVISNLSSRCISYFPCNIQISSSEKYELGDCVTFADENGIEKIALVSNITIKNLSSVSIDSLSIDLSTSDSDEEDETETTTGTTVSGNIMFYKTTTTTDIEFLECNSQTQIQYTLNFNIETLVDTLQVLVNSVPYKTYTVSQGNNTIALMLNQNLESTTTIEVSTSNILADIETMCIYRNTQIIDYTEEDEPITIGEQEYEIPSGSFLRTMKSINVHTGIQGWYYEHTPEFTNIPSTDENYGKTLDLQIMTLSISNNTIAQNMTDNSNYPEIYNKKYRDLYTDMVNSTFYIRVLFNGTYRDYQSIEHIKENAPADGWMVYTKKMKNDTEAKTYITTSGIIEVDDGTVITLGCICQSGKEHKWEDFTNNFKIQVENLNDDFQIANIISWGYGTYTDLNLDGIDTVKRLSYISNLYINYPDEVARYKEHYYIGTYNNVIYGMPYELSDVVTSSNNVKIINKENGSNFTFDTLNLFIYREFAKEGYEKYSIVE